MDPIARQTALAAAGAAGEATYVDDVFSTFLYEGSSATNSIDNGIDLSGEGGLVWIKDRDNFSHHYLFDTERGADKGIISNASNSQTSGWTPDWFTSFDSDGFTLGPSGSQLNGSSNSYVSWSFRKAPGFFDVVTYTGNGSNRAIAHNLGSKPGFIIIKRYSNTEDWTCWHRSVGATKYLQLNGTGAAATLAGFMNNTEPTSTEFTVSTHDRVNTNGETYIAYLFAHDDQSFGTDSNEAIIKCGSYTGSGSTGLSINVGFEPQFVILKRTDSTSDWLILDSMRGVTHGSDDDIILSANQTANEANSKFNAMSLNATGFTLDSSVGSVNGNGGTYVYIAIRRPNKPPTAGTEVFDDVAYTGNSSTQDISISPSIADSVLIKRRTAGDNWGWANRLTGSLQHLTPNSSAAEATRAAADAVEFDRHSAFGLVGNSSGEVNYSGETLISYSFKRAPGFFDVALFTSNSSGATTVNHNLGVAPEILVVKKRDTTGEWETYTAALGNTKYLRLDNSNAAGGPSTPHWNSTSPTATQFTAGSEFDGSTECLALMFASLDGISKVGTYSGTGNNVDVDCGFSAGARFVLIKRTDSDGGWFVWDTARGIVSGNDPNLRLDTADAESTNDDYIDPLNSGFTVTSSAPATLNTSGGTYFFLAIA